MRSETEKTGAEPGDRASASSLLDEALAYVYPAALRAVATVGVADHLADGPLTVTALASRAGVEEDSLRRVLRVLATRGVFEELGDDRFGLTTVGQALRSDVPISARQAIIMITDRTLWQPAGEIERSLRTGGSIFEDLFGMSFFAYIAKNQDTAAVFHHGMAAFSDQENEPIAAACDFPERAVVVDVGGGHGGFLLEVLRRRPDLHGVLFDEPHVVAGHRLDTDDVKDRREVVSGDFFTEVPAGDVHVIKRVLHDWDDDRCVTILRTCRQAMKETGRILVIDAVIPPGGEPHQAKTLDLLLMAAFPGRERTEAEFARLFATAGLRLSRIVPTGTVLSVIEATAAETP
ncbi:SAM-dependent methyltransferase [Nonomuraea sp. K274]|uniref:SAM-dependent methyltransferase n=1 Tax=Nonomuraea cypriaca TaxID=1187855 RepID=A0A931AJ47_9ACTN|nr:methyltransferase [Nonomuraea cypriaca]MBF8191448.1 SAM-dependent methyltransferase [Nonomuraea cypriaca]